MPIYFNNKPKPKPKRSLLHASPKPKYVKNKPHTTVTLDLN